MGPNVCYLLALGVMAYFIHLTPVRSQCTTKYCTDDANDENYLTAAVARLLDEVDREKQRRLNGTAVPAVQPHRGTAASGPSTLDGTPEATVQWLDGRTTETTDETRGGVADSHGE